MTFEEVKEMFKKSIDATDTMNQALENLIQSIYLKGYNEALEQKPRWIPVSERLPRASEIVLLSLPEHTMVDGEECYPCVICGHYIGGNSEEWGISDGTTVGYGLVAYKHCKPIAWMPLPQPYQSEIPTGSERSE